MTTLSFQMIQNLANVAKQHKETCNTNCNISLHLLKETALYIFSNETVAEEYNEVISIINSMPSY